MTQRLNTLFSSQNMRLFNLLFRHQVYLEGVKASVAAEFGPVLRELYAEFAKYILQTRYQRMDQFTRVELEVFIRRFQQGQQRIYSVYTKRLIDLLKQFLAVDVKLSTAIYDDVTMATDKATPIHGHAAIKGSKESNAELWTAINDEPVPASGLDLEESIIKFVGIASGAAVALARKGYANSWTLQELLTTLAGSQSKRFNDGLLSKLNAQNAAMIGVALQHVSSETQAAIASAAFEEYVWISVMDSHTTLICRSRNGVVYKYGIGPLPPAHYGCRSKTVAKLPGVQTHAIPTSYVAWLHDQSPEFINDIFGPAKARLFAQNKLDFSSVTTIKPLTISEFASKIGFILN